MFGARAGYADYIAAVGQGSERPAEVVLMLVIAHASDLIRPAGPADSQMLTGTSIARNLPHVVNEVPYCRIGQIGAIEEDGVTSPGDQYKLDLTAGRERFSQFGHQWWRQQGIVDPAENEYRAGDGVKVWDGVLLDLFGRVDLTQIRGVRRGSL